jgi:ribosomal protein L15
VLRPQGFFKVLGKGRLPDVPIIVKAKYFSKDVSIARA